MKYASVFSTVKNVELGNILSSMKPKKFIDTHCGTGWNFYGSENIPQEGSLRMGGYYAKTVVGLDIKRKHLLQAKVNTKDFSNIDLIMADANFLPLREGFIKGSFLNIDPSNITEMISLDKLMLYCSLARQITLTFPKIEWGVGSAMFRAKAYSKKGFRATDDMTLLLTIRSEAAKFSKQVRRIRGETRDHFRLSIEG